MTGLPAGHSAYSIQPTIKKLKNVDYYKLMKEKYVQKRAQLVDSQKKDSGVGQGLGAITILNGQRAVHEQSPIKLTVGQIRTKGPMRLRQTSNQVGQIPEPNTAGEADPDGAEIPEYHKESDCSSDSERMPSSTFQTPVAPHKAQSHEISKSYANKGQLTKLGRQSMAASPYQRDQRNRVNPPAKALHLHGTPNVLRKEHVQFEAGQTAGPIIPGFSMMNKTINTAKQFESQDEGTPQNASNRHSHHVRVGKDSSFNEWQSKFDQPTSQLMTTLYQDYNGSKRRGKSRSICTQQPSRHSTWEAGAAKQSIASVNQSSREMIGRAGNNLKPPPPSVKQFKEKTMYININDLGQKSFGHRKLSSVTTAMHNDFSADNRSPQPQSPQPITARMLAATGQSPPFSYGRAMGITALPEGAALTQESHLSRALYLPKINSN